MAWEYLKYKPFLIRHKIIAKYSPPNLSVLDINCGEPNFKHFYKYSRYVANDIIKPENTEGIEFLQIPYEKLDIGTDIILCLGYGGRELTGEPLESKTAGKTIIRLAKKYKPHFIAIEMVTKWEDDYGIMTKLKEQLEDYQVVFKKRICIKYELEHYHNKRLITIFKKC